jgi:nucleoside-diphosphate-sugar epimerase/glycosyltransferase involved in cell wall biosynthesis
MDNALLYKNSLNEHDIAEIRQLQGPIWVVGASGFIGAALFFALREHRQDVYAVSRRTDRSWRLLQVPREAARKQFINLDITQPRAVEQAVQLHRPRTVFNLAAYGAYERQNDGPRIHQVNYLGTFHLLQALFAQGCEAFVQAGSSSEYGLNCQGPREQDELKPNSDYAVSKGATALLLKYFGQVKSFPCANLRLYSVYGPWEERDRLIPRLVSNGLNGTYPPLADRRISRDFVYLDDCLRAFVRAALTVCKKEPGLSLNIATGVKTSLEDAALAARQVLAISEEPSFGSMPNRRWDLSNWFGNPQLAREKMGWEARVKFVDGLQLCAEWEKAAREAIYFGVEPQRNQKISAIIACYRDNQAIPIMHERLTKMFQGQGVDYEIIFINDQSPADDEAVIRQLCEKDAHVLGISHSRNFGSQSAFLSGMEAATGDAVVLLDGDLQDPPEIIPEFIKKWDEGYEVVYGVRTRREATWTMQILYKLFYRVFKNAADFPIPVDAGDFSLIDRKAVDHLLQLPEKDVFLRGLRAWIGFKQVGVPYVRPERMFGKTTNNFLKNIWWAKKGIFSFSSKPLDYIQRMGVFLFLTSTILALVYLILYLLRPPTDAHGATTIILLILGLGGIQLFSLSILGDYLGKVLEEVKNRPRFIRARMFKAYEVIETQEGIAEFIRTSKEEVYGEHR